MMVMCNGQEVRKGDLVAVSTLVDEFDFKCFGRVYEVNNMNSSADHPMVWVEGVSGAYHRNAIHKLSDKEIKMLKGAISRGFGTLFKVTEGHL